MSEEPKREKIFYVVKTGPENAELISLPFVHAVGAIAMDVEAVVCLLSDSVVAAKKGVAETINAEGLPPLKQLMDQFESAGGKILLCTPCMKRRGISEDDIVANAEPIAVARFTDELLTAKSVISY